MLVNWSQITYSQIQQTLLSFALEIDKAKQSLSEAQAQYGRVTSRRYYSTDEGHQASFAEHLGPLQEAEAATRSACAVIENQIRELLGTLPEGSAPLKLSDAERASLAGQIALLQHEAQTMNDRDLAARIRAAIGRGDNAAAAGYVEVTRERVYADRYAPDAVAVRELVDGIKVRLEDPEPAQVRRLALEVLNQAGTVAHAATARDRAANPPTYKFQSDKDVAW